MALRLYDTYTRQLRPFTPLNAAEVGLYACGPTVYHYAHIGNLRTYIFEDILRRVLEMNGHTVKHVMNITDVGHLTSDADTGEDKLEKASVRTGKSVWDVADYYTEVFKQDLHALNVLEPTIWAKATDHIGEQIDFVVELEKRGFTYRTNDGIYFDTSKLPQYGALARLSLEGQQEGHRIAVGAKHRASDFALWKFSRGEQRQMEWDSPWGVGFPGWHIECSAMSTKYLGEHFDIHVGGEDHVPVHHTNEIAQNEARFGRQPANFWLHGAFLKVASRGSEVDSEDEPQKMSKSKGDFLTLSVLKERSIDPLAYRYLALTAHYRTQLVFSWEALAGAAQALQRLRTAVYDLGAPTQVDTNAFARFQEELNHDLNTPRTLAVLWEWLKGDAAPGVKKATLLAVDNVLGLDLANWKPAELEVPWDVQQLLEARKGARAEKDWAQSDSLRDQMVTLGYAVKDTPEGQLLSPVKPVGSFDEL